MVTSKRPRMMSRKRQRSKKIMGSSSWFSSLLEKLVNSYLPRHPISPKQRGNLSDNAGKALIKLYMKCPDCIKVLQGKEGEKLRSAFEDLFERAKLLKPNGGLAVDMVHFLPKERHMKEITYKGAVYRLAEKPLTAEDIVSKITSALAPTLPEKRFTLHVERGLHLVGDDGVIIHFYSRPKGTTGADLMNAAHSTKINISAGREWKKDEAAPEKVRVEQFSGRGSPKLRAKVTTPEKAIEYVVSYFKTNVKELTEGWTRE